MKLLNNGFSFNNKDINEVNLKSDIEKILIEFQQIQTTLNLEPLDLISDHQKLNNQNVRFLNIFIPIQTIDFEDAFFGNHF